MKNNLNAVFSTIVPMMTTKPLLGISLAAVLAIGIAGYAYAGFPVEDYHSISGADAAKSGNSYLFSTVHDGLIPTDSNADNFSTAGFPVWGVVWIDGTCTGCSFTGVTVHPNVVDSRQNPDNWHPHTGTFFFNEGAGVLCVATLESPHGGIAINDDLLRVNIRSADSAVTPDTAIAGVSFFLTVNEDDCGDVDVDLPGQGLKPNAVSPPLPGLQVLPFDIEPIP